MWLSEPGDEGEQGGPASLPGQAQLRHSPYPAWEAAGHDSDSELAELEDDEEEEEDEEQTELAKELLRSVRGKCLGEGGGGDSGRPCRGPRFYPWSGN